MASTVYAHARARNGGPAGRVAPLVGSAMPVPLAAGRAGVVGDRGVDVIGGAG